MIITAPSTQYASHIALQAIGRQGQQSITDSKVIVVGLGGLGCPVVQYLVGSGVGQLLLCDFDTISESNLARQILYSFDDVNLSKADVARERLLSLNPVCNISVHKQRVEQPYLQSVLSEYDLLIDASDNYGTRLSINRACINTGTPWVMGSCIRFEGQLMFLNPGRAQDPCYRCVYGVAPETLEDCPGAGIFAPVAGMIGTAMAHLALSQLAGLDMPCELNVLDAQILKWRKLQLIRNPDCPECGVKMNQVDG
ncbi:MAG: molybdopterin/thiamine biosynthesis adenylyltransferase [Lysobacterales bacterium]